MSYSNVYQLHNHRNARHFVTRLFMSNFAAWCTMSKQEHPAHKPKSLNVPSNSKFLQAQIAYTYL
jgi:hypothetical protein